MLLKWNNISTQANCTYAYHYKVHDTNCALTKTDTVSITRDRPFRAELTPCRWDYNTPSDARGWAYKAELTPCRWDYSIPSDARDWAYKAELTPCRWDYSTLSDARGWAYKAELTPVPMGLQYSIRCQRLSI